MKPVGLAHFSTHAANVAHESSVLFPIATTNVDVRVERALQGDRWAIWTPSWDAIEGLPIVVV